jgi:class 3 adenylate cyclase/predicted ATPase
MTTSRPKNKKRPSREILEWLASLGLEEYGPRFAENDIDAGTLRDLTERDLEKIGVSLGHRKKMLRAIAALQRAGTTATRDPADSLREDYAERRQLTVMFCDLVGSTALSTQLDPEEMRNVIRAYRSACMGVIPAYEGLVARFIGDGILAYFGFPRAHEDDAERAVRAALDLVTAVEHLETCAPEPLKVRIGIATGLVVVGDLVGGGASELQAVVGDTPNLAARLQALAEPSTIVVSATTCRLLGGNFRIRDLGRQRIKGFAEPLQAWAVEGISTTESRFETGHTARLTGLVGRETEMEFLMERQRRAWMGEGQIVLISGEPGIGKSRIAAALRKCIAAEPHTMLYYQCSPYHRNSALHPFIAHIERAAGFEPNEQPETRLDKLETALGTPTAQVTDVAPLFAALLSIPFASRYRPLRLSPSQQRHQTFAALLSQLERLAHRQPVLYVFEDAHWADATSIELLSLSVQRISNLPILALITFRPEFEAPWSNLPGVSSLTLGRLDPPHAQMLVHEVTGGRPLPGELLEQMVTKADGIPLFIEELTKTVLESEILVDEADGYHLRAPLPQFAIPTTLQDSLMARLDRLAPFKEIAQIAAAIGREFSYSLLSTVFGGDEFTLKTALAQLENAELILRRGELPDAVYSFKHMLVQDTAYESLLKSRRPGLHRRIAETVRDRFLNIAQTEPEVVARHFTQAGLIDEAVAWWGNAGERALQRSAFVEANAHLGKALDLSERMTDGPAQRLSRLRLQIAYGNALIPIRGHGALETTAAFARARELAVGIEDATQRFSIYYGMWAGSGLRAELGPMQELAQAFLRDAKSQPNSAEIGVAHRLFGLTCWFKGDYTDARVHLEKALALYDRERDRPVAFRFGQDPGVSARVSLPLTLWPLGEVDRARHLTEEGYALAMETGHVLTMANRHGYTAMFEAIRRDARRTMPAAEAAVAISQEHGLPLWLAIGTFLHGWARWRANDRGGMAEMHQGMDLFREQGIRAFLPLNQVLLAQAQADAGSVEAGLATLEDALGEAEQTAQHWFDAEIHRQRGELLLRRDPADVEEAEAAFMRGIEIARNQRTRTFELLGALGAARLYHTFGRVEAARQLLTQALVGFNTSTEIPEVAEAGQFLSADLKS